MPRWLITVLLVAAAGVVAWALAVNRGRPAETSPPAATQMTAEAPAEKDKPSGGPSEHASAAASPAAAIEGLKVAPVDTQPEPVIGDASPEADNPFPMEVRFTPWGAGIIETKLSRYSTDVVLGKGQFEPYTVQQRLVYDYTEDGKPRYRYPMAAESIHVNGTAVSLFDQRWRALPVAEDKSAVSFELKLADGHGREVLRIVRTWRLERDADPKQPRYALDLDQSLENLSDTPLSVRFAQYGPMDLPKDQGYIGDQRHVILGYLQPRRSEQDTYITTDDFDRPRAKILDPRNPARLWPAGGGDERHKLLWTAMTNRYFTAAFHLPVDPAAPRAGVLESVFPTVSRVDWGPEKAADRGLALKFETGSIELGPKAQRALNVSLYAGPKSRDVLDKDPAYAELGLGQIIVYNLGGCCAACTFAWLANSLLAFLGLIHSGLRDWGIAIVILVAIVRLILHPLTKSSQVNMMKLSKQMQTLQPELDKIKAKYKDNPTKQQQEMMALYREKGVNPASMGLGCLPMFLQMPIWAALYAMLYFAIELRHQPAFWGIFQKVSGGRWPFLADLSAPDRFIPLPASWQFRVPLFGQELTAINILPILMGIVFFVQQKYMTPPPSPTMSPEMRQQQAMMKWMTVLMFPLMLFWAPSGLTLYIMTSTAVGIIESKRVRSHVKELEESGKLHERKEPSKGGFMDRLMKAAENRQKALEEQQRMQHRSGKKKNRD